MSPRQGAARRRGRAVTFALVAVVIGALAVGGFSLRQYVAGPDPTPGALTDMNGSVVVPDDPPDVQGAQVRPTGERFRAPDQGLDVPLESMEVTAGVINPPSFTAAFLIRQYGQPRDPASGLSVVTMHAVYGGRSPGNYLFSMAPDDSHAVIRAGDPVIVEGVAYTVSSTMVIDKVAATESQRMWSRWQERGNELMIITCLQRAGQGSLHAVDNLVVFAQRDAARAGTAKR
ncbi:hypothetical protein ATK17_2965 [Branchiibius hedensis]|uniref:Sortase family protein n=1 Tax=Branchiibius hedensis TaxID=672460 RepID=A0A2Y8ZWE8_9MICO|nr:class F sortase [Branchiibius hedensis]PWJ26787.1 hypothetical protein ATK17_2965 [Branchiibius hedensis]SSA35598.1 hypothetical protein SAMN04489750_2965 [Branchiibius hedensis]